MQRQSWQLWKTASCLTRAQQRALTPLLHKEMLRPQGGGRGGSFQQSTRFAQHPLLPRKRLADPAALKPPEHESPMPPALAEKGQTTP